MNKKICPKTLLLFEVVNLKCIQSPLSSSNIFNSAIKPPVFRIWMVIYCLRFVARR